MQDGVVGVATNFIHSFEVVVIPFISNVLSFFSQNNKMYLNVMKCMPCMFNLDA